MLSGLVLVTSGAWRQTPHYQRLTQKRVSKNRHPLLRISLIFRRLPPRPGTFSTPRNIQHAQNIQQPLRYFVPKILSPASPRPGTMYAFSLSFSSTAAR